MLFVLITALITALCILGLMNTVKDKNILGIVVSLTSVGVFGWFTVMTFFDLL